jgi:hypothetical protein
MRFDKVTPREFKNVATMSTLGKIADSFARYAQARGSEFSHVNRLGVRQVQFTRDACIFLSLRKFVVDLDLLDHDILQRNCTTKVASTQFTVMPRMSYSGHGRAGTLQKSSW